LKSKGPLEFDREKVGFLFEKDRKAQRAVAPLERWSKNWHEPCPKAMETRTSILEKVLFRFPLTVIRFAPARGRG
jgi:hypothetical protein